MSPRQKGQTDQLTPSGENPASKAVYARIAIGYYPGIIALFTATLIISNVCATKGVQFFTGESFSVGPVHLLPITTDGGFFLFPLAYVLGDVLSEVYGFKATRFAIVLGFAALVLTSACFWVAVELPSANFYENQQALHSVIGLVPRIVIAGILGYVVGQTLNSWVLVLIKARTREAHLWARLIGSTVVGEFADTLVFCSIAAGAIGITTSADFINYVLFGFAWKTLIEIVVMPVTYQVIKFIKRREPTYVMPPESAGA